jgi:hypothetical protein
MHRVFRALDAGGSARKPASPFFLLLAPDDGLGDNAPRYLERKYDNDDNIDYCSGSVDRRCRAGRLGSRLSFNEFLTQQHRGFFCMEASRSRVKAR